jgi:hypothetical protein
MNDTAQVQSPQARFTAALAASGRPVTEGTTAVDGATLPLLTGDGFTVEVWSNGYVLAANGKHRMGSTPADLLHDLGTLGA